MCNRLGCEAMITADPDEIRQATKFVLPGVGHFKRGMENLNRSGLRDLLNEQVLQLKKPILGICLGAQLMTKHSEEGDVEGLGWIDASTVKFDKNKTGGLKIPHMGWSDITITGDNPLWENLPPEPRFYFVHSYHFLFTEPAEISATAKYSYDFPCAFQKNNIFGAQFHPEKSHKFGMKIIENFNKL